MVQFVILTVQIFLVQTADFTASVDLLLMELVRDRAVSETTFLLG